MLSSKALTYGSMTGTFLMLKSLSSDVQTTVYNSHDNDL